MRLFIKNLNWRQRECLPRKKGKTALIFKKLVKNKMYLAQILTVLDSEVVPTLIHRVHYLVVKRRLPLKRQ